jgi:hypothetical protein
MPLPSEIVRHGKAVESAFDLLGTQENDITAALGFTASRSPRLLERFVRLVLPALAVDGASVRMEARDDQGRTDLEIVTPTNLVVVEAKRGWNLPTVSQLARYAPRVRAHGAGSLVTLSDCSDAWASLRLPTTVDGVEVVHVPWATVRVELQEALAASRGGERVWLQELRSYLRRAIKVRDPADGWAFCVSVSASKPGGGGSRTFLDFVQNDGVYFHPFGWGQGWPKTPPNFFALRWQGKVQQVRRVLSHEIVPNLQSRWPDIPVTPTTDKPCVVHTLGPPLRTDPLPSGRSYRANRIWVLIDQLMTATSLAEARLESERLTTG